MAKAGTQQPKHAGGRPTDYTQELADRICFELAQGKSLRTVCKAEDLPGGATVFSWLRLYPEFQEQYRAAKEESADAMAEEIMDIADDSTNDYTPGHQLNGENIQRAKLRVNTRQWLMGKLKAKKYGDKMEHSGEQKFIVETRKFNADDDD